MNEFGEGALDQQLLDQRRILVSGPLDGVAATELCAKLLTLDGSSDRVIQLLVNSPGGQLSEIFPILNVLGLISAPVNVTCLGSAMSTAVALIAHASGERQAGAHAVFSIRCERQQMIEGVTNDIERQADEIANLRARYISILATATGQDAALLREAIDNGGYLSAVEARELGIIDAIVGAPR